MRSAFVKDIKRRKKEFQVVRVAENLVLQCLKDKITKRQKFIKVLGTSNGCLESVDSVVHIQMLVEGFKV